MKDKLIWSQIKALEEIEEFKEISKALIAESL